MAGIHPIFIADSNQLLLDGLSSILSLEPTLQVIGTASHARELAEKTMRCSPEIILVDYDLYQMNVFQSGKQLVTREKNPCLIILTDHWENSLIRRIKAAGAMGCLRKTCDANELIYAIQQVLDGKSYFSGFSVNGPDSEATLQESKT